jgi:uncharacterized membrane protein
MKRETEHGQAIVLIAILMIVLMAITGLAIDGGGMFLLQRDAQNASDAAALSAAYALCTDGNAVSHGYVVASMNGFTNNETDTFVGVYNPPRNGYFGDGEYIQVVIEATKPSYFIHLVYDELLTVKAHSIARCFTDDANIRRWALYE